jgi:hypothetical protein
MLSLLVGASNLPGNIFSNSADASMANAATHLTNSWLPPRPLGAFQGGK